MLHDSCLAVTFGLCNLDETYEEYRAARARE
jgi:hypothetical protein